MNKEGRTRFRPGWTRQDLFPWRFLHGAPFRGEMAPTIDSDMDRESCVDPYVGAQQAIPRLFVELLRDSGRHFLCSCNNGPV